MGSGFLALSYLNMKGDEKHGTAPALKHQLLLCLNPLIFQQLFILPILGSSWIDSQTVRIFGLDAFFFFFCRHVRLFLTNSVFGC